LSLGTDLAYLRELVAYWADGFDWPAQEAALARLPRFRVPLGGLGIHFVHVRAAAPAVDRNHYRWDTRPTARRLR
jgi:Epoxide hydrolase N terminus